MSVNLAPTLLNAYTHANPHIACMDGSCLDRFRPSAYLEYLSIYLSIYLRTYVPNVPLPIYTHIHTYTHTPFPTRRLRHHSHSLASVLNAAFSALPIRSISST